ncbi:tRNA pseudouridine(13) synthase TruD [Dactylosporangium matsuzakiense]|uniref:tRNA pseudouridine13 synthase n=1 Tax=Dactylosporangium matsuzakiense TaxID=53360 RepID=A0A9W6KKD9_9ACTN|nr:tRNA pseudouridine(13) synthase TruD [Dactylosporangium matsuzakiense]GLL02119.1 hypothetical protein GCM10017581_038610 [Dactylosporangium matsuzakiense]
MPEQHAVLKHFPTDFVVREVAVPSAARAADASHRFLLLRKCGYTTFEAVRLVADTLGVDPRRVTYCGLKDEDAITEQLIAVGLDVPGAAAPHRAGTGERWIEWSHYGLGSDGLTIGGLVGNAFRIVVRNLAPAPAQAAHHQRKFLGYSLNYYWTQRFGVPGGPKRTHMVGRALLDRDWDAALAELAELGSPESASAREWVGSAEHFFLAADPRLTSFYLAAHASHLWNNLVRKTAGEVFDDPGATLELEGIEFLLPSSPRDAIRLMAHADSLPYTRYSFTPDGIEHRESTRSTVLQTSISVTGCEPDPVHDGRYALTLELFLPSGSYATSTVAQVMTYGLPQPISA